jgi:hypothetical protein
VSSTLSLAVLSKQTPGYSREKGSKLWGDDGEHNEPPKKKKKKENLFLLTHPSLGREGEGRQDWQWHSVMK